MAGLAQQQAEGQVVAQQKAKLRRVLRRVDLVLFTACAIVGLDSVAFAAEAGAQAITWLAIALVVFLLPYGMLVAELGSAFPVEGGPYEWVKLAFGRLAGSVTAVLYWLSNPIWSAARWRAADVDHGLRRLRVHTSPARCGLRTSIRSRPSNLNGAPLPVPRRHRRPALPAGR
jgi:hypothetical protein